MVLCNDASNVNVFVLTFEKATHTNPYVFVGERIRFHGPSHIFLLVLLQINFEEKCDPIGKIVRFGVYLVI